MCREDVRQSLLKGIDNVAKGVRSGNAKVFIDKGGNKMIRLQTKDGGVYEVNFPKY